MNHGHVAENPSTITAIPNIPPIFTQPDFAGRFFHGCPGKWRKNNGSKKVSFETSDTPLKMFGCNGRTLMV